MGEHALITSQKLNLIDHIETLPTLPAVVHQILAVTESENSSASDVARVLSQDQVFAAKVLRVANSSFYGAGRQVTQVSRAVVTLGLVGVRNLVLGIAARDAFQTKGEPAPEHAALWGHSIAVATAAEAIARTVGYRPVEEAFVAGLLHDIGQLAMVSCCVDSFRETINDTRSNGGFLSAEKERFGLDHTEAGFEILQRWGLPENMRHVVKNHHEREIRADDSTQRLLAIVMLADTIAQVMGFGLDIPAGNLHRATNSANLLKLNDVDQLKIFNGLAARIDQADAMFADVDRAAHRPTEEPAKRVIWVEATEQEQVCISRLLLENRGYDVLYRTPAEAIGVIAPNDIVILAQPDEEASAALEQTLLDRRHAKVIKLSESGALARNRWRDEQTGVFNIARLFTVFDIRWVEECLQNG
jgi:putative nucleotidyltransferase with HDIG domain